MRIPSVWRLWWRIAGNFVDDAFGDLSEVSFLSCTGCHAENLTRASIANANNLFLGLKLHHYPATARQFFHKPFVEASATNMPFPDDSFDALWSIWVLEHIPNPEKALMEMRRVVKPGRHILLLVANDVDRYAAQGYRARPYSDFNIWGKLKKSTTLIADSSAFYNLQSRQVRFLRSLGSRLGGGPSRLHFIKLDANYAQYWVNDSDACTSVSYHEVLLWFSSRGDQCLNCSSEWSLAFGDESYNPIMFIRVVKN